MEFFFWLCVFLSIYSYAVYPFAVLIWSMLDHKKWRQSEITPVVSIIISAYNEEEVIGAKIRNALDLDYPAERVEIIVSSDGSTDGTDATVAGLW